MTHSECMCRFYLKDHGFNWGRKYRPKRPVHIVWCVFRTTGKILSRTRDVLQVAQLSRNSMVQLKVSVVQLVTYSVPNCTAIDHWRSIRRKQPLKVETMTLKWWWQNAEISNIEIHELSDSDAPAQFPVSRIDLDKKRMQTRTECCWAQGKGGRGVNMTTHFQLLPRLTL